MPTTKTITLYTYPELSEKAQEKARDWYRSGNDFNSDFVIEDAKNMGALMGIDVDRVYYSGFWSQGDGACFEGSYAYAKGAPAAIAKETNSTETALIKIATRLQEIQKGNFYGLRAEVKQRGRYYHEMSTDIQVEHNLPDRAVSDDTEDAITQCLRDFMRWIYKRLETEWNYRNADEQVIDSIVANEYTFTEDGSRED
jgi:hypothetical protein